MRILQKNGEYTPPHIRLRLAMNIGFLVTAFLSFIILRGFQLEQMSFFVTAPLLILFTARLRDWVTVALKSLSNDYLLLTHIALPVYGGDIDHLLIGPNGLFVIEVKNYSGYVRCNQDQWAVKTRRINSLSKQAKRNSMALRSAIASLYSGRRIAIPYVTPLLVFANPEARLRLRQPTIAVLRLHEIAEFIRDYAPKRQITPEERRRIVHHLVSLDSKAGEMAQQENIGKANLIKLK
jgi:Nuclease-related domain